ncbi:MAG: type ISP restriction/modification enzyme [Parcubacteria group bacterium]
MTSLMSSPKVNGFVTTYPVAGSNAVEKPTYKDGKVWINKEQYFGDVPQVAWEFFIGGYQPAQKWLKDRKGRELSSDAIAHYQRIVKVLVETDRVMGEIDKVMAW